MKKQQLFATAFVAGVLALAGAGNPALAHDIDIYVNNGAAAAGANPLVMISIDLRSNVLSATGCSGNNCDALADYLKDADGNTIAPSAAKNLDVYRAAIAKVLQEEVVDQAYSLKVGLMVAHNNNNNCVGPAANKCSNGGYMLKGFVDVEDNSNYGTVNASYLKTLRSIPPTGNHTYQGSEMFFEFYRYLKGGGVYNGFNGWTDYGTNSSRNINDPEDYGDTSVAELGWDTSIINGGNYITPLSDTTNCTKIYTINFMFGTLNQDNESHAQMQSDFGITLPTTNNDRFIRTLEYLYDADLDGVSDNGQQRVESFFIAPAANNTENAFARAGSGGAIQRATELGGNPQELIDALRAIFRSILSTSVSMTAPSVSVNVYNRSQVLKDVYIAMFQAESYQQWPGNVKKYLLQENASGVLEIQDFNNLNAVNAQDGRIKETALSYWTVINELPAPTTSDAFDVGKDGRAVSRGGAGSKTPGFKLLCDNTDYTTDTSCRPGGYSPGLTNPTGKTTTTGARKVFTEPDTFTNGTATALMALNANRTTAENTSIQTAFGASGTPLSGTFATDNTCASTDTNTNSACNLIKFARGLYDDGTNRVWMMGDVLHSRPMAVNYGTAGGHSTANPNIRIFAGSNDGMLHMIRNTDTSATPVQEGIEGWAFMPRAVMPIVKNLKVNLAVDNTTPHPYGVDGTPTVYVLDIDGDGNVEINGEDGVANNSDDDKVYLFFGLGRGGSAYYGLNVTDPDNPTFLWRIEKTPTGPFKELGQTWSTPRVGRMVFNGSTTPEPVLVFAGGYDTNKDDNSIGHTAAPGGNDDEGNAIFIVKALTGELIWKAVYDATATTPIYDPSTKAYKRNDLKDSIPSMVTAVDTNGNVLLDRAYVGDTGGVVWRADFYSNDQANWTLTPIFSVGRHYSTDNSRDRRFFNPPDFVQVKDDLGNRYDAVIIGTGDRENPLSTTVTNWFYVFKDYDIGTSDLSFYNGASGGKKTHSDFADITSNCLQNSSCTTPPDLTYGWRMQLECPHLGSASACGEKNLAAATTIDGVIYFTTYIPPAATSSGCSPLEGSGLLYAVGLDNGVAIFNFDTNTAGLTTSDRYDPLNAPGIPTELVNIGNGKLLDSGLNIRETTTKAGFRTFWYEPGQ